MTRNSQNGLTLIEMLLYSIAVPLLFALGICFYEEPSRTQMVEDDDDWECVLYIEDFVE